MKTILAGLFAGLAAAVQLTGCAYVGNIETVNQHAVAFTSRSALQVQRGESHEASAIRDLSGGGTVSPETTVTP